ncbi:DMT family transporter [Aliagarivorans marinus]|uniref:DMT family transporter n=1 Tax=Aliagarivorans marinus TaxID=561965 RepID=UPI0003FE756C|nr:DMT family transporter [Aliagarivorans marinus]
MASHNLYQISKRLFHDSQLKGLMFALLGAALMSLKPILVKIAYQFGGDTQSVMLLRALSALPVYLAILCILLARPHNRKVVKQQGWKAALLGVAGYYLAVYFDLTSLNYISAQLERLILFLYPSIVIFLSWLIYKKAPTPSMIIAVVLGYFGVAAIALSDVSLGSADVLFGSSLAAASAFVFACYLLSSKPLIGKMGSSLFTSLGMASASIAILLHFSLFGNDVSTWSNELIVLGITLGLVCTVLPAYLLSAGMQILSPAEIGITSNIGPLITTVAAVYFLGEAFTILHGLGLVLVVVSMAFLRSK